MPRKPSGKRQLVIDRPPRAARASSGVRWSVAGLGQAMSRIGQHGQVADFPFPTTAGGPPGVEVTDVPGLAARLDRLGAAADAPVRPLFHLLVTVRRGSLPCSVDLTDCVVDEGCWLWVRPGQVFRLREPGLPVEAVVVLFQPSFLDATTVVAARLDRRAWRLPLAPAPELQGPVAQTLELLEGQYRRPRDLPLEVHVEVVRHLLAVLVLRLSCLLGGHRRNTAGDEAYRRFEEAVERDHAHSHRVEDYAARLGYSVRTLTRASNAAVGRGAKAVIDDRLVLEAKRLLLHTDLTAGAIGDRLGFPATTVFTRFLRHRTGETPVGFRTRTRARSRSRSRSRSRARAGSGVGIGADDSRTVRVPAELAEARTAVQARAAVRARTAVRARAAES